MKISVLLRTTVFLFLLLVCGNGYVFASDLSKLIDRNCYSCHAKVIKKFRKEGGAHATEVECRDCHLAHPQRNETVKIDCLRCHSPQQNAHFKIDSCGDCHRAHRPQKVDFSKIERPLKSVCFSCHDNFLTTDPSVHTDNLTCVQCHQTHGEVPNCLDCHQRHGKGKLAEPCLSCHPAHNPSPALQVAGPDVKYCSTCHAETSAVISADDGAHAQMACNICHEQHGQKPECLQCHGGHNDKMVSADCKGCHEYHRPMPPTFTVEVGTTLCVSCHEDVSDTFANSGGRHQQNLNCSGCHQTHPPATVAILGCGNCHADDSPHFAVADCSGCHNPHSPQVEDLSGLENVRPACVSCHEDIGAEMDKGATAHSEGMDCNQCHEQHGASPSCLDCHQGHTEKMKVADCVKCHNPHRPKPAEFSAGAAAAFCNSCHEQATADIDAFGRAHKTQLSCVDCHQEHPPAENAIPACADCHNSDDNPHFAVGACAGCHNPHKPAVNELYTLLNSRSVCGSCHEQVEEQLRAKPSAHNRDCVACHRQHRGAPTCLGCHDGHDDAMTGADCLACHQPHAPLQIEMKSEPAPRLCAACHESLTEQIESAGGAHRDEISCSSCHQSHPAGSCSHCHSEHPQKGQAIPESCYVCHALSSHPHFTVGDCQDCHTPHRPQELNLQIRKPLTPVCVSCHQQIADLFAEMPGGHSSQGCDNCHSQHAVSRKCLDCHEAHEQSMQQEDCLSCHSPHQPQDIKFRQAEELPQKFCAACHAQQAEAITEKGGAHRQELASCTACHPEHRPNGVETALDCGSCHARARRRHFTLADCSDCHNPHQPMDIDLAKQGELRPICVSCHSNQERLNKQYANKHTAFDCSKCHVGEHGLSMECQDCHKPHIPKMTQTDCLKCHPPHLPQKIKDKPGQAGAVCAACHQEANQKMQEFGSAHKKQPCVACHQSHPPYGEKVIADCVACHDVDDNSHFAVASCRDCHQGHQPLGHDLAKVENPGAACNACHEEARELFAATPSAHAEQACTSCHQRHGEALKCGDCHEPHSPGMVYADCLNCHSVPHAPNQVAFAEQLPLAFCQSCHADQVDALSANQSKHNQIGCVDCHQGTHGNKADCSSCHEPPHDPGLHQKYPNCLKCHIDPHDLADWQGTPEVLIAPEANATEVENKPAAPEAASNEGLK